MQIVWRRYPHRFLVPTDVEEPMRVLGSGRTHTFCETVSRLIVYASRAVYIGSSVDVFRHAGKADGYFLGPIYVPAYVPLHLPWNEPDVWVQSAVKGEHPVLHLVGMCSNGE